MGTSASTPDTELPADAPSLRLGARELVVIAAVWGFLALVAIAGRALDPRVPGVPAAVNAAVVRLTLVEYALWLMLTPALLWLAGQLTTSQRHRIWKVLVGVLIGLALAILVDAAITALREGLLPPPRRRRGGLRPPEGFRPFRVRPVGELGFVDDLMVYFAVVSAGVARAVVLIDRARRLRTIRLEAQAAELRVQLADARLDALRAQLDPHFLFNTLNAVSALVERDPRGVRRMISRLGELLRHTLESATDEQPIARELELLDRYLDIMRVRFGDRLRVTLDVAEDARDALVPNLLLQPLVENAIKHAVAPREAGGTIGITVQRAGDQLRVWIRDDGPGPDASEQPAGAGVGLRNTRARLAALYGGNQRLDLRTAEGGGAIVEVILPYHA